VSKGEKSANNAIEQVSINHAASDLDAIDNAYSTYMGLTTRHTILDSKDQTRSSFDVCLQSVRVPQPAPPPVWKSHLCDNRVVEFDAEEKIGHCCQHMITIECPDDQVPAPQLAWYKNGCDDKVAESDAEEKIGPCCQRRISIECPVGQVPTPPPTWQSNRCGDRVVVADAEEKIGQCCQSIKCPVGQVHAPPQAWKSHRCDDRVAESDAEEKIGQCCEDSISIECPAQANWAEQKPTLQPPFYEVVNRWVVHRVLRGH
jgi:hypothetical protein